MSLQRVREDNKIKIYENETNTKKKKKQKNKIYRYMLKKMYVLLRYSFI